jgi:hypothetical protein
MAARQLLVEPLLPVRADVEPGLLVEIEERMLEAERVQRGLDVADACRSLLEWLMKIAGMRGRQLPRPGIRLANTTPK